MAPRALLTRKEPFFILPMVSLLNMCLHGQPLNESAQMRNARACCYVRST